MSAEEKVLEYPYHEYYKKLTNRKHPAVDELVIARVVRIESHGIYVFLDEYNVEAYIPLKEISTKFIKHPREVVKLNQRIVAKVYSVRKGGLVINASLKRVLPAERQRKLQEWRKLRRSLILMAQMAKELGVSLEEVIEKVGAKFMEYYDTPYDGFEAVVRWGEEILREVGVPDEWIPKVYEVIKENVKLKEVVLKQTVLISSLAPDAVDRIKKALSEAIKISPEKIEVEYISSPKYLVRIKGYDWKEVHRLFKDFMKKVRAIILTNNKWPTTVEAEEEIEKKPKKRKRK
ncbi:MAG: S1 RNA-binding domain-containing protein [Candidatus Njordarchaeales archaeon]